MNKNELKMTVARGPKVPPIRFLWPRSDLNAERLLDRPRDEDGDGRVRAELQVPRSPKHHVHERRDDRRVQAVDGGRTGEHAVRHAWLN